MLKGLTKTCSLFRETSGRLRSLEILTHPREVGQSCPLRIVRSVGGTYKNPGPSPSLPSRKVHSLRTQNFRQRVASDYRRSRWVLSAPLRPILPYTRRCPRGPALLNPRVHLESRGRRGRDSHRHGYSTRSGVVSVNHKPRTFLLLR